MAAYPEVPTMVEAGFPDFVVSYWIGLFAPAGLPAAVQATLEDATRDALAALALL